MEIDDSKIDVIQEVIYSHTIIDELIGKNSDDIVIMKKVIQENDDSIRNIVCI